MCHQNFVCIPHLRSPCYKPRLSSVNDLMIIAVRISNFLCSYLSLYRTLSLHFQEVPDIGYHRKVPVVFFSPSRHFLRFSHSRELPSPSSSFHFYSTCAVELIFSIIQYQFSSLGYKFSPRHLVLKHCLFSSVRMRDHVSCPHKSTRKIVLMFIFFSV